MNNGTFNLEIDLAYGLNGRLLSHCDRRWKYFQQGDCEWLQLQQIPPWKLVCAGRRQTVVSGIVCMASTEHLMFSDNVSHWLRSIRSSPRSRLFDWQGTSCDIPSICTQKPLNVKWCIAYQSQIGTCSGWVHDVQFRAISRWILATNCTEARARSSFNDSFGLFNEQKS